MGEDIVTMADAVSFLHMNHLRQNRTQWRNKKHERMMNALTSAISCHLPWINHKFLPVKMAGGPLYQEKKRNYSLYLYLNELDRHQHGQHVANTYQIRYSIGEHLSEIIRPFPPPSLSVPSAIARIKKSWKIYRVNLVCHVWVAGSSMECPSRELTASAHNDMKCHSCGFWHTMMCNNKCCS